MKAIWPIPELFAVSCTIFLGTVISLSIVFLGELNNQYRSNHSASFAFCVAYSMDITFGTTLTVVYFNTYPSTVEDE